MVNKTDPGFGKTFAGIEALREPEMSAEPPMRDQRVEEGNERRKTERE
jgi:hypothetical protein